METLLETKGLKLLLTCVCFIVLALRTMSQAENKPEIKISGLIYANYEYALSRELVDGTPAANFNSFDVGRIYLNAEAKYSDTIRGFLQFENNIVAKDPWTGTVSANGVFLKQAFLEVKNIYPGANVKFGLIPNPWRGFEEGIWKHRFVSKIQDDIEGLLAATDRGIRLNGKKSLFEYDMAIVNGEGPKGNETSKYKDYIAKLSVGPFSSEDGKNGLKMNLYGQTGRYGVDQEKDRLFGGLSYESEKWNAMATYETAKDEAAKGTLLKKKGYSIHTVVNLNPKSWVFGRYDKWDPDTNTADDGRTRYILGYGYTLTDGIRASLNYQATRQEKEGAANKDQSALFYHIELKF